MIILLFLLSFLHAARHTFNTYLLFFPPFSYRDKRNATLHGTDSILLNHTSVTGSDGSPHYNNQFSIHRRDNPTIALQGINFAL